MRTRLGLDKLRAGMARSAILRLLQPRKFRLAISPLGDLNGCAKSKLLGVPESDGPVRVGLSGYSCCRDYDFCKITLDNE